MPGYKLKLSTKLYLLLLLPLFFLLISFAIPKSTYAAMVSCGTATCNTSLCTGYMCNGPNICQTQCEGCSHASINQCANEWALGTVGDKSLCTLGSVCNPNPDVKFKCNAATSVCEQCAPGDTSCTLDAGCPGTTCEAVAPPGPPAPAPPARWIPGDKSPCYADGVHTNCAKGGTNYNGLSCCPGLICKREGGPDTEVGCYPPRLPAIINSSDCGDGSFCDTALGRIPTDVPGFVTKFFAVILSISGIIALILIIIAGYKLMVSRGNPEQIQNAREQLTAAIVGLLFVIFSLLILQVIGDNILDIPGFTL